MKNQTFGIEIETTALGRRGAAEAIAAHFGTEARYLGTHLSNWVVPMPGGRHWTVESDSSVTDPCAEVVSPVCTWDDIPMVQEVVRKLKKAGARVDGSCGIHIHVGLGAHTPQSLRRLVNIVNAKEDLLTMALGISSDRRTRWCRPVDQDFLKQLNLAKPATMDDFAALWYSSQDPSEFWRISRTQHYNATRYHLLNLHAAFSTERPAHTIEFRAFNRTLHAGKIFLEQHDCTFDQQSHLADCIARVPEIIVERLQPLFHSLFTPAFKSRRLAAWRSLCACMSAVLLIAA